MKSDFSETLRSRKQAKEEFITFCWTSGLSGGASPLKQPIEN